MRLHAAMGLGLRAIVSLHHHIRAGQRLLGIATRTLGFRPAHIADQRETRGDRHLHPGHRRRLPRRIHQRRVRLPGGIEIDHKRQRHRIDAHQQRRSLRRRLRSRRHRRDRRAHIAHNAIRRCDHQHRAHPRRPCCGIGIDRPHPRMRQIRANDARMQQPVQLHIDGKAHGAGHLRPPILAYDLLADHLQRRIDSQRRRLTGGNLPLDGAQPRRIGPNDADREILFTSGHVLSASLKDCIAASTCG